MEFWAYLYVVSSSWSLACELLKTFRICCKW
jgi:hypothetical protein